MARKKIWTVEGFLAASMCTTVGGFRIVVQFMASAVLGASEDLATPRKFTSMYALSLLRLADTVGSRSIGDRRGNFSLRAVAHSVLAANHGG